MVWCHKTRKAGGHVYVLRASKSPPFVRYFYFWTISSIRESGCYFAIKVLKIYNEKHNEVDSFVIESSRLLTIVVESVIAIRQKHQMHFLAYICFCVMILGVLNTIRPNLYSFIKSISYRLLQWILHKMLFSLKFIFFLVKSLMDIKIDRQLLT